MQVDPNILAQLQAQQQAQTGTPPSQDRAFSQWILDLRAELMNLEHRIRGDTANWATGQWEPTDKPNINKEGLNMTMANVSSCATRIAPLTQYTEVEINAKLFDLYGVLLNNLWDNSDIYELELNQLQSIIEISCGFVGDVYNAAKNGEILKFFKTTRREDSSEVIQKVDKSQDKKAKWSI